MAVNEINRQAAEWAAKSEAGALSQAERSALEAWLSADIRHLGAYTNAIAVLAQLDRVRAAGVPGAVVRPRSLIIKRRMIVGGSLAAALVAVILAGVAIRPLFEAEIYETGLGESRTVQLADGSQVALNTDSKIVVRYTDERRSLSLKRGEALFAVAKNKARPFVVAVNDLDVRAVGTHFAIRALPGRPVRVLVEEGVVEVKRPSTPVAAPVLLHARDQAVAPADAPIRVIRKTPEQMAQELAWQTGRIAFEDTTLAAAAVEFSRYSQTRIVIDDSAIARRTVTGLFLANDPVGFAKAVALSLGLEAESGNNEVRIVKKR